METTAVVCDLKLENFEGPFDLLFHLIEKNEMDIYDIRISEITDQYLDFLFKMEKLDMDIASEFLVTAATLLHIKSRMLLPTVEDEEPIDPREELVLQLLEYKKCKSSSELLKDALKKNRYYFYREESGEDFGKTEKTYTLSPGMLKEMFILINERKYNKQNKNARKVRNLLRHEKYTVGRKLKVLVGLLLKKNEISFFEEFKSNSIHKLDIIVGFLSILEMAKEKKARLKQRGIFLDIKVSRTKKLQENDFNDIPEIYK